MTLMMKTLIIHSKLMFNDISTSARYHNDLENWQFEILPFIRVYWKNRDIPKLAIAIKMRSEISIFCVYDRFYYCLFHKNERFIRKGN